MNQNKKRAKFILDRIVNVLLVAIVLVGIFIDIRLTVIGLMIIGLFFLNIKGAVRGFFLGLILGILIALVVGVITKEWAWSIAIVQYGTVSGAVIGLYIGGLIGTIFHGPSNKFIANTFSKFQQENSE